MTRKEILVAAEKCICGDREKQYGNPEDNFGLIAAFWGGYLGIQVTPTDVAMLMVLLKIARVKTGVGTADSFIDGCGYFACGGELQGRFVE